MTDERIKALNDLGFVWDAAKEGIGRKRGTRDMTEIDQQTQVLSMMRNQVRVPFWGSRVYLLGRWLYNGSFIHKKRTLLMQHA